VACIYVVLCWLMYGFSREGPAAWDLGKMHYAHFPQAAWTLIRPDNLCSFQSHKLWSQKRKVRPPGIWAKFASQNLSQAVTDINSTGQLMLLSVA